MNRVHFLDDKAAKFYALLAVPVPLYLSMKSIAPFHSFRQMNLIIAGKGEKNVRFHLDLYRRRFRDHLQPDPVY